MDLTEKTEKLAVRLAKIMGEVGYVQKRGKNTFHGYNYATEADIVAEVRGKLAAAGILFVPDVVEVTHAIVKDRKGNDNQLVTLRVKCTFTDGTDEVCFHTVGQGIDSGDKAPYKALTGACKYGLLKPFMIPTGDDPEANADHERPEKTKEEKPQPPKPEDNLSIQEKVLAAAARIAARDGDEIADIIKKHSTFKGNDGEFHFFTDPYNVPVPGEDNAAALKWLGKTLRGLRKDLDTDQTGLPLS